MLFRIVDLEAGDPSSGELLFDRCVEVPAADSLCRLDAAALDRRFDLPPHRVRFEVAAWRPEVLADRDGECPPSSEVFTLAGEPIEDARPRPAFAGVAVFDVGGPASEVVIPLSCVDPEQLDQAECVSGERTVITALVDDVETAITVTRDQAADLTVKAALPQARADGTFEIVASQTIGLPLQDLQLGSTPTWEQSTDADLGELVCTIVSEDVPQSTSAVACERIDAAADPLSIRGIYVGKETFDPLFAALGAAEFPPGGLLVGRVLDHTGAPLAGVSVTPASGTVQYLSSDRASLIGTRTSTSAFFVSTDVPFDTPFTATHNVDGRREEGSPRAGIVRGQLTVVFLRMAPP